MRISNTVDQRCTEGLLSRCSIFSRAPVRYSQPLQAWEDLIRSSETAAEENSTCYFPLLDRIAEGYFAEAITDHELYTSFLHLLRDDGHITDPESLSSFQFALSIHSAAPRIEAHYQYYNTSVEPSLSAAEFTECPVWVHFEGKKYCSPELERAQQDVTRLMYGSHPIYAVPQADRRQEASRTAIRSCSWAFG